MQFLCILQLMVHTNANVVHGLSAVVAFQRKRQRLDNLNRLGFSVFGNNSC